MPGKCMPETKFGDLELAKRQVFPRRFGVGLFQGIFQVVNFTDLRDLKYIFKLDEIILDFSLMRLL